MNEIGTLLDGLVGRDIVVCSDDGQLTEPRVITRVEMTMTYEDALITTRDRNDDSTNYMYMLSDLMQGDTALKLLPEGFVDEILGAEVRMGHSAHFYYLGVVTNVFFESGELHSFQVEWRTVYRKESGIAELNNKIKPRYLMSYLTVGIIRFEQ